MQLKPGDSIGEYEIIDIIGDGGFSVVYKATDTNLQRLVAIKQFMPELFSEEGTREWFVREARLSASLNHPNIVSTYALREQDESLFLVMEYLPGGDLHTLMIEQGMLNRSTLLKAATNVCHALETLHARGVIHRDIKPENILIAEEGHFKLADFGLAHIHHHQFADDSTGPQPGTLLYMSPEQAFGQEVTVRSDIYSLAVVLYEAMTGHYYLDFDNEIGDESTLLYLIGDAPPLPIESHHPTVPYELSEPLLQALSKAPEYRPASARAFLEQIKNAFTRSKRGSLSHQSRHSDAVHPKTPPELLRRLYAVRTLRDAEVQPEQAQEQLTLIWEMSPGVPEVAAEWGETLVALGDVDQGRAWLERAVHTKSDIPFAQLALAEIYRNAEMDDEADDAIIEAIQADPDLAYAALYQDLVSALQDPDPDGFHAFVSLFRRAADNRKNAPTYHNLGQVLALNSELEDDAMQAFRLAIRLDPDYGPAYVGLGSLLTERDMLAEAIPLLQQAAYCAFPILEEDDWHKINTVYRRTHAYVALAVAYAQVGNFESSAEAAFQVMEMAPDDLEETAEQLLDAYIEAAEAWIREGQYQRVYEFLNHIVPLAASWGRYEVFMLLGIIQSKIGVAFRRKGQWDNAVKWLQAALQNLQRTPSPDGSVNQIAAHTRQELDKAQKHQGA